MEKHILAVFEVTLKHKVEFYINIWKTTHVEAVALLTLKTKDYKDS
jgi:hypothetical protein